jgi:galactokinase
MRRTFVSRESPPRGEAIGDPGPRRRSAAFAPGRVNQIGEHTDYNQGLALPFAIAEGVTVRAEATDPHAPDARRIYARARDLGEEDEFELSDISGAGGWRAFVRGTAAELAKAGHPPVGARLEVGGDLEQGAGLSSSAALEVALCLALAELASRVPTDASRPPVDGSHTQVEGSRGPDGEQTPLDRIAIAQLCARVENDWVGAQTGMLDQLASLYGAPDTAVRIDFRTLQIDPVPLRLEGWRFVLVDSGERHANASSGYNERRTECRRACELMGIDSLRDASTAGVAKLPEPLRARAEHVLGENVRVEKAVAALSAQNLPVVGELLNASHASLRERYAVSTPAVERTVERLRKEGAAGARLMGGGFGGSVLGLFAPGVPVPPGAREVRPGPGAHLLATD